MADDDELIPVFTPALGAVLISAEDNKGEPLNRDEVIEIRDSASCTMMDSEVAGQLAESRGYDDLDPDNCWYDWQMLRRELGRTPDLDAGSKVDLFSAADPAYQATILAAKQSLDQFRSMLPNFDPSAVLIKTDLSDSDLRCNQWLTNVKQTSSGFTAELFESPVVDLGFTVGESLDVLSDAVSDWMINDDGRLHGGFSLRYHRANLPEHEREAFDNHIGVTSYVD